MIEPKKEKIDELLLNLPNIPHESVPKGLNQDDNKIVSRWGEDLKKDFTLNETLIAFDCLRRHN